MLEKAIWQDLKRKRAELRERHFRRSQGRKSVGREDLDACKILSQSRLLALGSMGPRSPIGYRSHLRDRAFEHADSSSKLILSLCLTDSGLPDVCGFISSNLNPSIDHHPAPGETTSLEFSPQGTGVLASTFANVLPDRSGRDQLRFWSRRVFPTQEIEGSEQTSSLFECRSGVLWQSPRSFLLVESVH